MTATKGATRARPVNNLAMLAASEKPLAQYLRGCYQASMTPAAAQRLGKITVDPKPVALAAPSTASK